MLVNTRYYTRTNGGLVEWIVTDWLLFGFILIYRNKIQAWPQAKGG